MFLVIEVGSAFTAVMFLLMVCVVNMFLVIERGRAHRIDVSCERANQAAEQEHMSGSVYVQKGMSTLERQKRTHDVLSNRLTESETLENGWIQEKGTP